MKDERTNNIITCEHCGAIIECESDAYFRMADGSIICANCACDTFVCDCCGQRFEDSEDYGNWSMCLCEDCYNDNYTHCEDCGCLMRQDDVWDDEGDELCESCYDERMEHKNVIKDYCYKPDPIFFGHSSENYYMGVELEIDCGGEDSDNAKRLLEIMNDSAEDDRIYIKHDGSISGGMEIVSHPCSLYYHRKNMPWQELMKKAIEMGYRSHQTRTCGLHVHISKKAFGRSSEEQENNISKLLFFVEKHWNEIVKFSRREQAAIDQWCRRYGYEKNPKDIYEKTYGAERYHAINLRNYQTVEFRIFRGTLKYNTFIATLEFIEEIVDFVCSTDEEIIDLISWSEFVSFIAYPELIQYLKERNLYTNDEINYEEDM